MAITKDRSARMALREKMETHRKLKDASPGFHLSDDDFDILIEVLREDEGLAKWTAASF